jgi:hypothetical protein
MHGQEWKGDNTLKKTATGRFLRACSIVLLAFVITMVLFTSTGAQIPIRMVQWEPPMTVPTPLESNSWFPNLAVDSKGTVHIIWCETYSPDATDFLYESIFYTTLNGNQWSQFTDVAAPIREIRRNSLTIDNNDILHMSFIDSFANNPYRLGYGSAPAENAFSTNNWSPVIHINDRGQSYMNEIVVFENTIHVLYEDTGSPGGVCGECADIFYRRSMDGGVNWDAPVSLLPTGIGTARPHLSVDSNGTLYASWDEGWDRHSGRGTPEYSVFTFSMDLGETWAEPVEIRHPNETVSQLTIEGNGEGGIMLVWRTTSPDYPGVYFQWSNDYGDTWTQPATLSSFTARRMINYFDSFDMATDSAGHIHLIAPGYLMTAGERLGDFPGLFHFEWDGQRWYPPTSIYNGGFIPEYPRIFIERGNQLHTTWFIRHNDYDDTQVHEIMYARGAAAAPALEPPVPVREITTPIESTPTASGVVYQVTPEQPQLTPTWEPTPVVPATPLFTEFDEYMILLAGMVPAALFIGAAAHFILRRNHRRKR